VLEEIKKQLEKLAFKNTDQFSYSCYKVVKTSHCPTCHSDDFMRHLHGVGVEYGTDWVIDSLIEESLTPIDTDEVFEDMIRDCYSETTKLGWVEVDTAYEIKTNHPCDFRLAKDEYIDSLIDDEQILEFSGKYYWVYDIKEYIEKAS